MRFATEAIAKFAGTRSTKFRSRLNTPGHHPPWALIALRHLQRNFMAINMLTQEAIFPSSPPPYYESIVEGNRWVSGAVTIGTPRPLVLMSDLGYEASTSISQLSDVLLSEPIEIVRAEEAFILRESVRRLREATKGEHGSVPCEVIRAAAYRSAVIRDFCLDKRLADFVSRAVGRQVVATALVHQLGITNYTELPDTDGALVNIGGWHIDQNAYVIVMSLGGMDGANQGYFEYFDGTREEGLGLILAGRDIPPDRVRGIRLPGPGWGVVMHGSMLLHRAGPAIGPLQRISMVTAFEPRDVSIPDQNLTCFPAAGEDLSVVEQCERQARAAEYARHKAWRTKGHLDDFLGRDLWDLSPDEIIGQLTSCARDIVEYVELIRRGDVPAALAIGEYLVKTGSSRSEPEK